MTITRAVDRSTKEIVKAVMAVGFVVFSLEGSLQLLHAETETNRNQIYWDQFKIHLFNIYHYLPAHKALRMELSEHCSDAAALGKAIKICHTKYVCSLVTYF